MNVRVKLFLAMLLLSSVPILILTVFFNNSAESNAVNTYVSDTQYAVSSQGKKTVDYLSDNINQAKDFALDDNVRELVLNSFDNKDSASEYEQLHGVCLHDMDTYMSINKYILYSFVINCDGKIVVSSDKDFESKNIKDIPDIFSNYQFVNGASDFTFITRDNKKLVSQFFARQIFDSNNAPIGYYLQVCDTAYIQELIEGCQNVDGSVALFVDGNKNVYKFPYDTLISYDSYKLYSPCADFMNKMVSSNSDIGESCDTNLAGKDSIMYGQNLYPTQLTVFTYVNQNVVTNNSRSSVVNINLCALMLFIVVALLILVFIYYFTLPLMNIVDVLGSKRKGNHSARFKITTSDEFGELGYALNSMLDDITESELRYRTIVEMTDNIVFEINLKKQSVFVSNNFNQKFSFRAKTDKIEDSFFIKGRVHKDDKLRLSQDLDKILAKSNYMQGEYRFKNIYGDFAWIMIRATKFFDRDEVPTKIIGVMVDIDKEKKSEMHLIQRANYDALTQVYNRASFMKELDQQFAESKNTDKLNAVLFLDLDDFKHFNDEYGHACGDEVLKFTADCLKESSYEKGFVGRFGGDEFVVCLTNVQCIGDTGKIASEVIENLSGGFLSESIDKRLSVGCSIGIAFFYENGNDSEQILNSADEAMYTIKKHGKSNYAYASGVSEIK